MQDEKEGTPHDDIRAFATSSVKAGTDTYIRLRIPDCVDKEKCSRLFQELIRELARSRQIPPVGPSPQMPHIGEPARPAEDAACDEPDKTVTKKPKRSITAAFHCQNRIQSLE
ncbi:hypothetical protein CENSYa_0534 [Cenarchaeum symbiosum A]|uniref:Uncharacterized protein n=1 Tax=Cenarchaeum symbiosum (strain A) TaxID=414004 RepID=A0RV00_CENSY|nr:hypothetical protein CENSYa_0534 [Cenarchaeum symbiosum A]